ncbi:hypothetical protein GPECTOR_150g40 [Gonium pectorale]|uniref:Uncharacterized protein n=1 Tax=Gonium pectorale TaxID=33097 RepID=A0A150FXR8_GONPE|nr:hypothetical protein GPECTOR_150g40 [Gonium pectorale]|eukprot:KXZ42412.1 hypothetical protein GPECTOR_150g40 [Gonium pectorale]
MVCWWSSGLSYAISLSAIPSAHHALVMVVVTLILEALFQGVSPTIREARGSLTAALQACSFNRWATEAVTIREFKPYFETGWNLILAIYIDTGMCDMDLQTGYGTGQTADLIEQLRRASRLRTFNAGSCDGYARSALGILAGSGVVLRLLAYFELRLGALAVRKVLIRTYPADPS